MNCRLCGSDLPIVSSHIISEFLYESLYDEKHRFQLVPLDPERREQYRQKGLRERLLCEPCEQRLSVHEDYMRRLLKGGVEVSVSRHENRLHLSHLDYSNLKLFQLSVLWRSGVATLPEFSQVILGPHETKLRTMLNTGNPGSATDYGCIMTALLHGEDVFDGLVVPPTWTRIDGHKAYRFVFGGLVFLYVVSGSPKASHISAAFAQPDGTAVLRLQQASDMPFLTRAFKQAAARTNAK